MLLLLQRILSEVPVLSVVIFNCGPLIIDASLVSEDFFGRSRISPIIKGLNSRSLCLLSDSSQRETFSVRRFSVKVKCELII